MCSEITHFGEVGCGTEIKLLDSMGLQANRIQSFDPHVPGTGGSHARA